MIIKGTYDSNLIGNNQRKINYEPSNEILNRHDEQEPCSEGYE